ncbi:Vgb family protein [Paraliomyxa miuraensis]|uniref:Vgb family protein n=1 Tax=Paraliomyxa miuraensis TaxID=376150 RepID=UPI00225B2608|nr:hypothetical protein [Paraliomyxa miuraensis]MCX4241539.1 hypothetical protein [Paraliomyxa miuraensis]
MGMHSSMGRLCVAVVPALALACGGDGDGRGDGEGDGGIPTTITAASNTDSATGQDEDSNSGTTNGTGNNSGVDSSGDGDVKFDLGTQPDANVGCGGGGGGGGGGAPDFSYIWIANSNSGSISKVDTQTLIEEGRYVVRPDSNGNPSRTSVNLNGDVAVANRSGGVTKIYAIPERCDNPANTSTGAGDVKAWPDGCIAWHTPFAYASQRPVQWTQGTFNTGTCRYEDTKVWTSGANGSIDVVLMDGETGVVEATVPIPGVNPNFYGIYGGAVDSDGNFWGSQLSQGYLVRVRLSDLSVSTWPMATSGYGMTVDSLGQVWTCSSNVGRFDPITETWQTAYAGGSGGCMEDGMGTLWLANDPMVGVDINTMAVVQTIDLPSYVHGISIDFQGNVWGPAIYNNEAYRVNPVTGQIDTVTGFNLPYTYSDMTGFALSNVGNPIG